MRRVDNRTVMLTQQELDADERFNELLDDGLNIADAADRVLDEFPGLSSEFAEWLSK